MIRFLPFFALIAEALLVVVALANWRPNRPRFWVGRKVSVVVYGRVYRTRIIVVWSDRAVASVFEAIQAWRHEAIFHEESMPTGNLWFRDEGTTWCLGWGSEQAKALEVAAALKAS